MKFFKLKEKEYAIDRVEHLKKKYPEAQHILDFYSLVLNYQKEVYNTLEDREPDWRKGEKHFRNLLEIAIWHGSDDLSKMAWELKSLSWEEVQRLINHFLKEKEAEDLERFFFLAYLRPFYERIAEGTEFDIEQWLRNRCPVCGFRPHVSYIMDREEIEGGRYLTCILCGTSWLYNRNRCVKCGNEDDNLIDYYCDESNRAVQLQACNSCKHYIKLVDLRTDGLAVPEVEDVASVVLDLWAKDRGFLRFERNIFGL